MASMASAPTVFLLSLYLLFSTLVCSEAIPVLYTPPPPTPIYKRPPPPPMKSPPPITPSPTPPIKSPPPITPSPPPPNTPLPPTTPPTTCPRNSLNITLCADVLGLIVLDINARPNPGSQCCSLIDGLVDLEAAVCLCTVLKANVLGILRIYINIFLRVILNSCGKRVPPGYTCV